MRVFLSWSGYQSKAIAAELKQLLHRVFENESCEVFMSEEDISAGKFWFDKINEELSKSACAIICITSNNLFAPWLYYEAGALASRRDVTSVIPFLFHTDLPANSPLALLHHVKFERDKRITEKSIRKMIKDVKKEAGFTKSTDKQTDLLFNEAYESFTDNLKDVECSLVAELEKAPIMIYPHGINEYVRDSIFISAPMSGLSDTKYQELRATILKVKEVLSNNCGFKTVYYAGDQIVEKKDFDGEIKAVHENLASIKRCEAMVVFYPDLKSSVQLEVGYAIALTKKIVLFTRKKDKLPFMLKQADVAIPNMKIFEYQQYVDVIRILSHNGKSLFYD